MMNDIRLAAHDEWRSRFTMVTIKSCSPAEQLFCVGKSVDYKRRQVGRLWGEIHQKVGRRLTKPEGFVVCRA